MLPYLQLGPFLLQTPGLSLLIGVWIGMTLAEREANKLNINKDHVNNLVLIGLVAGVLGARLAYVSQFFNIYFAEPLSLFALNADTLSPSGGLVIGVTAAILYAVRKKIPLRPALDALAPSFAFFMIFLGIAHLLSGDAFGSPTRVPWAIYLWGENRHPSQIYEILMAVGTFLVIRKPRFGKTGDGRNFILAVALLAASRLLIEIFRGDSQIVVGGFRTSQVVSLLILIVCLWLLRHLSLSILKKENL